MGTTGISLDEKHYLYERLMISIFPFPYMEKDSHAPFLCYPYVIKDGKEISLEEAVKRAFRFLPRDLYARRWQTEEQIRVLISRYGLEDGRPKTFVEVGKQFNTSGTQIGVVEARIFRRLRHPSHSSLLRLFFVHTSKEIRELREGREQLERQVSELNKENRELRGKVERIIRLLEETTGQLKRILGASQ